MTTYLAWAATFGFLNLPVPRSPLAPSDPAVPPWREARSGLDCAGALDGKEPLGLTCRRISVLPSLGTCCRAEDGVVRSVVDPPRFLARAVRVGPVHPTGSSKPPQPLPAPGHFSSLKPTCRAH